MPDFFPEAWSLSIEEWFYIIVPSSILLLSYIFKKSSLKSLFLYYSLSIIFIFLIIRLERYLHLEIPKGFRTWDLYFNRQVITRLDSLMFGVFAVFIKHYYPKVFLQEKITVRFRAIYNSLFSILDSQHTQFFHLYYLF
jgi:peptidoglycan/LPS O-acetylase OafA/YrhL